MFARRFPLLVPNLPIGNALVIETPFRKPPTKQVAAHSQSVNLHISRKPDTLGSAARNRVSQTPAFPIRRLGTRKRNACGKSARRSWSFEDKGITKPELGNEGKIPALTFQFRLIQSFIWPMIRPWCYSQFAASCLEARSRFSAGYCLACLPLFYSPSLVCFWLCSQFRLLADSAGRGNATRKTNFS